MVQGRFIVSCSPCRPYRVTMQWDGARVEASCREVAAHRAASGLCRSLQLDDVMETDPGVKPN